VFKGNVQQIITVAAPILHLTELNLNAKFVKKMCSIKKQCLSKFVTTLYWFSETIKNLDYSVDYKAYPDFMKVQLMKLA